ncbi:hypothetical protein MSG28_013247 [Choristoneura fumiferana]|uniref:Uncharacterized protein n=1 Tax=Choristoneura fumiferana TaxID=7141 RepID=A0ACC0KT72_CHOFU|nr:hypothetical protein MSG28_013247 [Choristoneura fumiferana]
MLRALPMRSNNYDYEDVDGKRHALESDRRNWRKKALLNLKSIEQGKEWDDNTRRRGDFESVRYPDDMDRRSPDLPTPYRGQRHYDGVDKMANMAMKSAEMGQSSPYSEKESEKKMSMNCDRPHERYEACFSGCAAVTCDNPRERLRPCYPFCEPGCICIHPYVRDDRTHNIKLTQDFRRHYVVATPPSGNSDTPTEPPPTTAHALEAHVDEIAKDTGDLSDWLYNQFFKTIENQVINKTDDDELLQGTRRSGGSTKRTRNKNNKKKNFKKSTKRGLRRKLLRISEDDSMFDSSSSDSRSDSRDSSGTWESWEDDMGDGRGHDRDPNKDHGHRKIVVYSKQPKPPLPSFIFLPNVETPFYPPIGLPVPPMPMYPMIPVPPIQPFIIPPETNNSTGNESTPTTQGPETTTKTEKTTVEITTEEDSKTTSSVDDTNNPSTSGDATASVEGTTELAMRKQLRSQGRKKLLQRLKDRNKKQIIKRMGTVGVRPGKTKSKNHFIDANQDPSIFTADNFFQQPIEEEIRDQEKENLQPFDDDVDFKYLTQLIHRVDGNQTKSLPTASFTPKRPGSFKDSKAPVMYRNLNRPPLTPGRLQAELPTRRRLNDCSKPDDNYYSNLGKQIATLIRDIHPDVVSEVDIDIARTDRKTEPFLGENSFAPRSYWERFVRSPLRKDLGHFSKYEDLRISNEQLFDLESKVEVAASSQPILTLQELENVISTMNKVQKNVQNRQFKQNNFKPSKGSLNVSLLPRDRSKPTEVPKKLTNEIIIDTPFNKDTTKVLDKKGVLSRHSRWNKPINNNAKANIIRSNFTKINELFKDHKLNDDIFFNIPRDKLRLISTITPTENPLTPYTKSISSPPLKTRPVHIRFNRNKVNKVNSYYFDDIHTATNLKTEPKKPNTFYIKSKPASYFFNEFDFFVKKKK